MALISIKESPLFPYDGIELIWTLFWLHDYSQKTRPDSLIAMPKWVFALKKKTKMRDAQAKNVFNRLYSVFLHTRRYVATVSRWTVWTILTWRRYFTVSSVKEINMPARNVVSIFTRKT